MDVWRGNGRGHTVTGVACVCDDSKGNIELKILLACTVADMKVIDREQNTTGMHAVILQR